MDIMLSSDSDALICVLYAEYLCRRSHGVPIEKACYFSRDTEIHDSFLSEWLPEDVSTVLCWLHSHGLITCIEVEGHCFDVFLSESGIIYMESRFARKRESVIAHLKDLVSFGVSVVGIIAH